MGVYALIIGAFCGIGIATATGSQLVPKLAFGWVPSAWGYRMNQVADIVTGLFLLGAAYYASVFVNGSRLSGLLTSGGLDVPAWMIQVVIPLGFVSAAVRYVLFAIWPLTRPTPPEFQE
jgi:TRAP-type C4-dicarboxylate transport system permease small subunit